MTLQYIWYMYNKFQSKKYGHGDSNFSKWMQGSVEADTT